MPSARTITAPLLLTITTAGASCMLSPSDGYVIGHPSQAFSVLGVHLQPGVELEVEAWNYETEQFDPVGEAFTDEFVTDSPMEEPVYLWDAGDISLDPQYWDALGCVGQAARVRTREVDSGRSMLSVIAEWGACWEDNGYDLGTFVARCTADRTPEAQVVTADYVEFPPGIDGVVPDVSRARYTWNGLQLELRVSNARYTAMQMRTEHHGITEVFDCSYHACTSAWLCLIDVETSAYAEYYDSKHEFGDAFHDEGTFSFRAYDSTGCPNGPTWTDWTRPRTRWFVSGGVGSCNNPKPDPPPPPPEEPSLWSLACLCQTQYGSGLVELEACMTAVAGAAWMCEYFESDFEAVYGTPIECSLFDADELGEAACMPGTRTVTAVDVDLY